MRPPPPDVTQALGPGHPYVHATRNNLAASYQDAGNISKAIDMHQTLLSDLARVLGPDHLHTLAISQFLSVLRRQSGGAEKNQQ